MKKKAWILTLVAWMVLCQSVWGANSLQVDTSQADTVTVSTEIGENYAGRQVTIEVLYPGQKMPVGAFEPKTVFSYLGQTKLDENGALSVQLVPGDVAGYYTVRVKVRGTKQELSQSFAFASGTAVNGLVEELRSLDPALEASFDKTATLFKKTSEDLLSGSELLGLTALPEYGVFQTMQSKDEVLTDMLAGFQSVTTKADIQQLFSYSVCLENCLALPSADKKSYILKNKSVLGLNASIWCDLLYGEEGYFATEDNQTAFAEWLNDHDWTQTEKKRENFAQYFDEGVFITLLANLQTNGELVKLIEAAPDWLKGYAADVDSYSALDDKASVNALAGGRYESIKAFVTAFNSACQSASKPSGGSAAASGSSGGGSGSSGSRGQTTVSGSAQYQPEDIPLLTEKYSDIETVAWAKEAIDYLTEQSFVSGREVGKFYPNDVIKREEFSKLLTLAFSLGEAETDVSFSDVPEDAWFYSYVTRAAAAGVVLGYDGVFGVGQPVTRQDAAVMLYRAALQGDKTFETGEIAAFDDEAAIRDYAKEAVHVLHANGIIHGVSETEFAPGQYLTRAEAAKLIYLLIK